MAVGSNLDRYQYVSTLGTGGMATVVLAQDELLGRQVALKRMTPSAYPGAVNQESLVRLRREALLGASISHPNLVSIYDVVHAEDGDLVIVMEYVPGETLADALARRGQLGAEEALGILKEVAAGLDAIHRRGIVHRDVKPANILLGTSGTVKLADLGIAAVPDRTRITSAGAIMGSFRYMAPEQLEDTRSTPAIDVYALAAVAFEMLSGTQARREPNPLALAHAIATQPAPDLRDVWPEAPAPAADLLRRAMDRDPTRRPASAGELVRRLRAGLLPEETRPIRPPRPLPVPEALPVEPVVPEPQPEAAQAAPARDPHTDDSLPPLRLAAAGAGLGAKQPGRSWDPERRRRVVLLALLALTLAAVVVAIVLASNSSSPGHRQSTLAGARGHRRAARAVPGRPGKATKAKAAGTGTAATGATSAAASTSGNASGGTGAYTGTAGSSGTAAAPASGGASTATPTGTVASFYGLAAAHRYAEAWALADPAFRSQLGGYNSFAYGQAAERYITFNSNRLVHQSADTATVAIQTTSVRTDRTQHCSGTVDLVRGGSGWLIHQIHITCV